MPKAKHSTLNKLKDAIVGGKEEQQVQSKVIIAPAVPSATPVSLPKKQKRKYTKTSKRWTTKKDVNDAVLKDVASSCCNSNKNTNTDLLDIPVDTKTVQAPSPSLTTTVESGGAGATDESKFRKINAWKSPWEKLYVMITLKDSDRMRLAYIQKKLKTINSAEIFRDGLELYFQNIKKEEKEKKLIRKN